MKNKDKTVLFVMPRLPFPMTSGRKNSLYHYCRILSEELGYRLIVAAFLESGDNPINRPNFIDKLIILSNPGKLEKIFNIIAFSLLKKEKPLQVSLYKSRKAKMELNAIINEEQPDYVIADMVRCTDYIIGLNAITIADLDDRISLRYQRQLDNKSDSINPYGALLNSFPKIAQRIMLWKPLKIRLTKNEIALLTEYEKMVGQNTDRTIFVAASEAKLFNKEIGLEKALPVPIGVDITYYKPNEKCEKGNYVGFLGALNVTHNEEAVRNFIINIFPCILKKDPNVKFIVIGGGASDSLLSYASENIVFLGRVDDIRDYLTQLKVFVCPMTFGSGIKTKVLEAMAMGIPVVLTSIGAENIDAVNFRDWIVTDNNEEFADNVIQLLKDEKLMKSIGKAGRDFVETNWTWDKASEALEEAMK